jgi:hypothetical protein
MRKRRRSAVTVCVRIRRAGERGHDARGSDSADDVAAAVSHHDKTAAVRRDGAGRRKGCVCAGAVYSSGAAAARERRDDTRARHDADAMIIRIGYNNAVKKIDADAVGSIEGGCRAGAVYKHRRAATRQRRDGAE